MHNHWTAYRKLRRNRFDNAEEWRGNSTGRRAATGVDSISAGVDRSVDERHGKASSDGAVGVKGRRTKPRSYRANNGVSRTVVYWYVGNERIIHKPKRSDG